jgi:O-antigen/teichoic acid export membrane protein
LKPVVYIERQDSIVSTQSMSTKDSGEVTAQALWGGSTMLLASGFGNGLGYLLGIVLARLLGAEDFGLYALGMAIFNVTILVSLCGADTMVVKGVSAALQRGDRFLAAKTVVLAMVFVVSVGLVAAIFLLWSSHTWLLGVYSRHELVSILTILALTIPAALAVSILVASFQATHTYSKFIAIRSVWEPLGKLVLALAAVWAGWGLVGVVGGIGVVSFISLLLAAYFARTMIVQGLDAGSCDRRQAAELAKYGIPLFVMTVVGVISPRTDVLLLGYWSDAVQVGLYQAAYQTAAILTLTAAALDAAFAPLSAGLFAVHDLTSLKHLYCNVSRWLLTVSFPIALILVVFGSDILSLFGPTFPLAAGSLLLLALGHWFNTWTTFAHTILLMSGWSRLAMWNGIGTGVLLLFLNWLFIPRWGITGAAFSVSLSLTIGGLLRVGQVWLLYGLHPFSVELVKPVEAGLVALLVGYVLRGLLGTDFSVALLAVGVCYLGLLYCLKIEDADRVALTELMQRVRGKSAALAEGL